ncbi:MAG: thioredoxin-like domain-containing protein [Gelidibacter sp.]
MNIRIVLLLTLSTLLGCKNDSNNEGDYAYFGGEIINPNNNYVVLNSPDEVTDTLYLNENNRFIKKLTSVKAGLYTFIHGGEYQRVLIEPKDSIMVRLNTIDFDESLVFTGEGARKNNYLIACFVDNEADNKKFMQMMWETEPKKFEEALNADRDQKLAELKKFLSQKDYSNLFKSIAESNINYDYYYYKELYPFSYYGYNNLIHYKDLPEHFYDFRADVDYNNENLKGVIPYYRFLFYHFNNLALGKYYENATHNVVFDNKSVVYNLEKLRLMDSLIDNENIKNHLLKYTTRDFIATSEDSSETNEVLTSFMQKSSSDKDKSYIKKLASSVNKLKSGNKLPNILLLGYDDREVDLNSLISKPTVVYFWSSNYPLLMRNTYYKVKSLKSKYPEVDFVAININDDDRTHWKNTVNQYKFSPNNEYQFQNPTEAMNQLAINSVNKSILVNGEGTIINSNAMIYTSEFEEELEHFLHKKEAHQE